MKKRCSFSPKDFFTSDVNAGEITHPVFLLKDSRYIEKLEMKFLKSPCWQRNCWGYVRNRSDIFEKNSWAKISWGEKMNVVYEYKKKIQDLFYKLLQYHWGEKI